MAQFIQRYEQSIDQAERSVVPSKQAQHILGGFGVCVEWLPRGLGLGERVAALSVLEALGLGTGDGLARIDCVSRGTSMPGASSPRAQRRD